MNNRSLVLRTLLTFFGLTLSCAFSQSQQPDADFQVLFPDSLVQNRGVMVATWNHPQLMVVEVPDTIIIYYLPQNEASIDSIARKNNLRCIINGSFFKGVRGNATHAGWLSLYGERIEPLMDDRQLTHIVRSNGAHRTIDFLPVRTFVPSEDPQTIEFQTGPLVIANGAIQQDLIRSSINGPTPHTRSLLATLDQRRCFFITVTDRVTLADLAARLLRLSVFQQGKLDVVNLDGGSSVALYLRDTPDHNYNADDRLPILIGFR